MPNTVMTYHTYGEEAQYNANSFNFFPRSAVRDFGIIMMSLHQAVVFDLFAGPLGFTCGKISHTFMTSRFGSDSLSAFYFVAS